MFQSQVADEEIIRKTGLYHRVHKPEVIEGSVGGKRAGVVMVHGRAGTAELMWTFAPTFRVLKPVALAVQAQLVDAIGGYSWWLLDAEQQVAKKRQTKIEQLEPAVTKLERFIDAAVELYSIERSAFYALGFSQGAAVVAALSLKRPEMFKGVGMLAGFIPKIVIEELAFVAPHVKDHSAEMPRYFIAHGTRDETVPVDRAERAAQFFESFGAEVELVTDDVGHKVGSQGMKALKAWFDRG